MSRHKLSAVNIAFLYVGTLMGAGFASGREIWQFFGVFGEKSYPAVLVVALLLVLFGMMTVKISHALDTTDIGKIIMPFENTYLSNFFGSIMAAILFLVYVVMAAAGGALFHEQFGLPKVFGGVILMLMVIATILGGFERISKNFKYIIPVLLAVVFFVCLLIIFLRQPIAGSDVPVEISPLTPNWYFSAVIYISYNMLAGIPIMASSAHRAKSYKTALTGAALGGLLLGLSALIMDIAMLTDTGLSSKSVLPILALSGKLSDGVRWIYAVLLLFAVYSSATSNFYGFTTKIKDGPKKKFIIMLAAVIGFLLSLFGFAEIIAFILPLEGYCGLLFLIAMTVHFFRIRKSDGMKVMNQEKEKTGKEECDMANITIDMDKRFQFADGIKRVTAGPGGEVILITGSEKTAVLDCGMAFCGAKLVENIKRELKDSRTLDYILLSHTHYDHMGGLPYLKQEWPEAVVVGAQHAKSVFESKNALKTIRELSLGAEKTYKNSEQQLQPYALRPEDIGVTYRDEDIKVDLVVREGDLIDLGDQRLRVVETPGHTNCSLSFFQEEKRIFFPAETMGCFRPCGDVVIVMLKGYQDTVLSIEKGKRLNPQSIISPHYGQLPDSMVSVYWDRAREAAENCRKFILDRYNAGMTEAEILKEYREEYWRGISYNQQPQKAFDVNAKHVIHAIIAETEAAVK